MDKSRIFIASSSRTLVLAEMLRDQLNTDYCEAILWKDIGKSQLGATIIEMLERAKGEFDFAVILLAKDDVIIGGKGDTLKARDNCVFEAGLFIASLGRHRCFLVNSVNQGDLPSDLGGVISIPFKEPRDLNDRMACRDALASVAPPLKDAVQRDGKAPSHERIPILSPRDLFELERPQSEGGDLLEGQVVVCDTEPAWGIDSAVRVRRNIDSGVCYHFFTYFTPTTMEKMCQGLEVILAVGAGGEEDIADFKIRLSKIRDKKEQVLDDLRRICESRSLRFTLLNDEPNFCFRVHNASNRELARLYARYQDRGFLLWAKGASALALWNSLPKWLADDQPDRLLIPLKQVNLEGAAKATFEHRLNDALRKYFPGIENEIKKTFVGSET